MAPKPAYLSLVAQFIEDALAVAPVVLDLDPELQIHPHAQQPLHVRPGGGAESRGHGHGYHS